MVARKRATKMALELPEADKTLTGCSFILIHSSFSGTACSKITAER